MRTLEEIRADIEKLEAQKTRWYFEDMHREELEEEIDNMEFYVEHQCCGWEYTKPRLEIARDVLKRRTYNNEVVDEQLVENNLYMYGF